MPQRDGGLILLYHKVGSPELDPFHQCVSAENFAAQMHVLAGLRPVRLLDMVAAVRGGSVPRGSVAVTFDDGYANNLLLAKPVLERTGVPATVFVTSGKTGADVDFWWNELGEAMVRAPAGAGELRLVAGGEERSWSADAARLDALFEIWAWLRRLEPDAARRAVAAVREWAGLPPAAPLGDPDRFMTEGELRELVAGGLVEVGAHTRTHAMLSALSPAQQRSEIVGSREDLERRLGTAVTTFAYPFGRRVTEYRAPAVRAVRAGGFAAAVAVRPGLVDARAPLFELPRYPVADVPGDEFAAWVEECFDRPQPRRGVLELAPVRALRERVAQPGRL